MDTQAGDNTGSLSLDLTIAEGVEVDEVNWEITDGAYEKSGTTDVSAPGSTASLEVFGLPAGSGYLIQMWTVSVDGVVACGGSEEFDVDVGETTPVMVFLHCQSAERLGAVRVNGKFNVCAELVDKLVTPLQTSVGNDIDLMALAVDPESDPIEYRWTATGGSIADAYARVTTYTCEQVGEQTITIQVSDDGFDWCTDSWTVPVTCGEGDVQPPEGEVLGPVYPPDFPVTDVVPATDGGDATDEGGQDLYFTEFDRSLVEGLGWGNDASQPIVLSLDGTTAHTLTFNAGNSDLPAGVLTWTGSSPFTYWDDGTMAWVPATVATRLTLTITDGSGTPIALLDPAGLGLSGQIGGIAPIEENYPDGGASSPFTVHLLGEAFFDGSWYPALILFNNYQTQPGQQVIFDFWHGFYYAPLP
jgi:hypothetical protein